MRYILLALLLLGAVAAFGQAAAISAQPQVFIIPDHPQHASLKPMACESPLVGGAPDAYTYAQGERPLWEFGPVSPPPTPLGDVARAFRKEKLAAKKAGVILEKQGS